MSSWGITSPAVWAMLLGGLGLIGLFVRRCLVSSHPILNFQVLKEKNFSMALLINIGISMAPVSYTHLDVYKRQRPNRRIYGVARSVLG